MGKNLLFLAVFTSITMLLSVLAVMRYGVPIIVAFAPVVLVFLIIAVLFVWRNRKGGIAASDTTSEKSQAALKWLFIPFAIGAAGALVMALQRGWSVGDTIGAIFLGVFALLLCYEVVRRRRATHLH
jgi:TctA family transporter